MTTILPYWWTERSGVVSSRIYSCDVCTAQCTFEAMQMCQLPNDQCPVLLDLKAGVIVDRRATDRDPNFPSEFTYRNPTPERKRE